MRFLFSLLSMLAFAVTLIMAVVDAARIVAADRLVFTPLGEALQVHFSGLLQWAEVSLTKHNLGVLWDPVLVAVLAIPGWLVFGMIAFLFHAIGWQFRKRKEFAHIFR